MRVPWAWGWKRAVLIVPGVAVVVALLVVVVESSVGILVRTSAAPVSVLLDAPALSTADPYITYWQGSYYYTATADPGTRPGILIWRAPTLEALTTAKPVLVWSAPPGGSHSKDIWAPELQYLNGGWYIYFSADDGDNAHHRLYVLQATSQDPLGAYVDRGQLVEPSNNWAIDPDVFRRADGSLYLLWSGWARPDQTSQQNLYIARLRDPLHIAGARVALSHPTQPWEQRGAPIEEGPVEFEHGGKTFITFSASASWTDNYAIGLLTFTGGDLLDPSSWTKTGPIFEQHGTVYGPGSFMPVVSPDGSMRTFLYHAAIAKGSGWARTLHAQPLYWDADGSPLLGYPVASSGGLFAGGDGAENQFDDGWGDAFGATSATVPDDGVRSGSWSITSPSDVRVSDSDKQSAASLYRGNPNLEDYEVTASAQLLAAPPAATTAPGAATSEYGVYACYSDPANYVAALLDPSHAALVIRGSVGGVAQALVSEPLPAGFDPTQWHTLTVRKSGSQFTFALDGTPLGAPTSFGILNGQIGLTAQNAAVHFEHVNVSQPS